MTNWTHMKLMKIQIWKDIYDSANGITVCHFQVALFLDCDHSSCLQSVNLIFTHDILYNRYIDLDLYKNTVGTQNDLKPQVGTLLAKGC